MKSFADYLSEVESTEKNLENSLKSNEMLIDSSEIVRKEEEKSGTSSSVIKNNEMRKNSIEFERFESFKFS